MQVSAVILAFAATVSADLAPGLMSIRNLHISSLNAAHSGSYQANVSYTGQSGYSSLNLPSDNFSDLCKTTSSYVYAPSIDGFDNYHFDNQAFTWAIIKNPGDSNGYILNVNYTSSGGDIYRSSRAIPESEFSCSGQSDNHGQDGQYYTGPSNFTLDVYRN